MTYIHTEWYSNRTPKKIENRRKNNPSSTQHIYGSAAAGVTFTEDTTSAVKVRRVDFFILMQLQDVLFVPHKKTGTSHGSASSVYGHFHKSTLVQVNAQKGSAVELKVVGLPKPGHPLSGRSFDAGVSSAAAITWQQRGGKRASALFVAHNNNINRPTEARVFYADVTDTSCPDSEKQEPEGCTAKFNPTWAVTKPKQVPCTKICPVVFVELGPKLNAGILSMAVLFDSSSQHLRIFTANIYMQGRKKDLYGVNSISAISVRPGGQEGKTVTNKTFYPLFETDHISIAHITLVNGDSCQISKEKGCEIVSNKKSIKLNTWGNNRDGSGLSKCQDRKCVGPKVAFLYSMSGCRGKKRCQLSIDPKYSGVSLAVQVDPVTRTTLLAWGEPPSNTIR